MASAAMTPQVVQKRYLPSTSKTGTPIRLVQYYLKSNKVTQYDWILLETAIGTTGNSMVGAHGIVMDSSSDVAAETLTYVDATDKLNLSGSTVGSAHLVITMSEA